MEADILDDWMGVIKMREFMMFIKNSSIAVQLQPASFNSLEEGKGVVLTMAEEKMNRNIASVKCQP